MPYPSGRRLLRWPFTIHRSPQLPNASFSKPQPSIHDEDSLAEEATQPLALAPDSAQDGEPFQPNTLTPPTTRPKYPPTGSKSASMRYRRYYAQKRRKHTSRLNQKKWFLITLALVLFIPSFFIPYELTNIYVMYRQVQDGLNHLQAAANVFHGTSNDGFTHYLDATKLQQVQADIDAAHASFVSLDDRLAQDSLLGLASPFSPAQINSLRAVGRIADDGTAVAQQVLKTLRNIAPDIDAAVQNSSLSSDPPMLLPFLTPASYQEINTTLKNITPLIHRITLNAQNVSLTALPLSSKQRATLASILPLLPAVDGFLSQWSTLRDPLAWLLGINQQRSFLVEPMDSSELRATGGFTGQFGELVLNGAHPGPIKLANIGKYEEDHSDVGSPPDQSSIRKSSARALQCPIPNGGPFQTLGCATRMSLPTFPPLPKLSCTVIIMSLAERWMASSSLPPLSSSKS